MLDLVTTNAAARHFEQGDMFGARHNDPSDVSLYEQFAGIKKVPIEALIPVKLAGDYLEPDQTVERPQRMDNYFALMNTETNALLDTRPISRHYALVPHAPVFGNKPRSLPPVTCPQITSKF